MRQSHPIVGLWKITSWRAHPEWGVRLMLCGGQGDVVEFRSNHQYYCWTYNHKLCRYRVRGKTGSGKIDLLLGIPWTAGRYRNRGIFELHGRGLTAAFSASGFPRPVRLAPDEPYIVVLEYDRLDETALEAMKKKTSAIRQVHVPDARDGNELLRYLRATGGKRRASRTPQAEMRWLPFCDLEVTTGRLWAGDPFHGWHPDEFSVAVPCGTYCVEGQVAEHKGTRFISCLRVRLARVSAPTVGKSVGEVMTDIATLGIADLLALDEVIDRMASDDPRGGVGLVEDLLQVQLLEKDAAVLKPDPASSASMACAPTGGDGSWPVHELLHDGLCVGVEIPLI